MPPVVEVNANRVWTQNIVQNGVDEYIGKTDKPKTEFRQYDDNSMDSTVKLTYHDINTKQTVQFVREQLAKWHGPTHHSELTMMQVLDMLAAFVDESDPDTTEAQQAHAFQTAERCRELFPENEWMALVGLCHDAGKIIGMWGQPQWATVGDTFPVGATMAKGHVFSEFYDGNPDAHDDQYKGTYGMYKPNCGLDKLLMSYGHDEYLYQVLVRNNCKIPPEGLYIIRFHSFYSHHQHNAYAHFCNEKDEQLREWLQRFQKADLYSKSSELPNVQGLREYYQVLIDKYCPGILKW